MEEINTQFCDACLQGDLELAQQLLKDHPDIDISYKIIY